VIPAWLRGLQYSLCRHRRYCDSRPPQAGGNYLLPRRHRRRDIIFD